MPGQVWDPTVESLIVPFLMWEKVSRIKSVRILLIFECRFPEFECARAFRKPKVMLWVHPNTHHIRLTWISHVFFIFNNIPPVLKPAWILHEHPTKEWVKYILRHLEQNVLIETITSYVSHVKLLVTFLCTESSIALKQKCVLVVDNYRNFIVKVLLNSEPRLLKPYSKTVFFFSILISKCNMWLIFFCDKGFYIK